jgi:hypothetical protein
MTMFSNWRRRELEEAARTRSWKQTPEGYEMLHQGSLATLSKSGKTWVLSYKGQEKDLGRKASFDAAERALQGLGEAEEPPVLKKGDVWTFVVGGSKVTLDKAQRTALRSVKAGSTNPERFKQLEKKGLVVRFGERQGWKQWASGKTSTQITGYLSPLGEQVFALMQQELGGAL